MPNIVRSARGEMIDFDTIIIKQQLAAAPMNIEVARRKEFIDSKEGKSRSSKSGDSTLIEDTIVIEPIIQTIIEPIIDTSKAKTKK